MRRSLLWLTAALLFSLALAGCAPPGRSPRASQVPFRELLVDESVESDLQALAEETWAEFRAVFAARTDCFGDVHLRAVHSLDSRAAYDPETATVTVRVPATAALLQGALVHEWAHHIEFQCPAHEELRPAFLAAQGLPTDTPWRPDSTAGEAASGRANDAPSEQYAEATIVLVLGRRSIATSARVTPEAVDVVKMWAEGW